SRFLVSLFGNMVLLVGILVLSFAIEWRVGLTLTSFAVVALAVLSALRNIGAKPWEAQSRASASLFGFFEEYLSGTEDLRANGANAFALRRLAEEQRNFRQTTLRAVLRGGIPFSSTSLLLSIGTALGLLTGAYLFRASVISLGSVYLIFAYTELLRRPLEEIGRQMQQLQQASASVARVGELLQVPARVVDGPGAELKGGPLTLAFDDVSFWYEDDEPAGNHTPLSVRAPQSTVLDQVSFELAPGQVLGLLGRTGSGKTTIARLVFRLYDPQHGAVRLNGYDIRALTQSQVRGHIGLVTQDIQLFHATVRDNLTFFDPSIPDERIVAVLDDLGMRRWLDSLPGGLDTRLAPDGGGISAGQAQLLAFARVFLRNPGLVILDEASSRLDPATEQAVERAVERLLQGRTAIIIAHRLPTVQRADQILILDRGHIREFGPRTALAADPESHFSHLLRTGMEEALA
ncbi:MAG TPA: ABC transporter ATP-binding protein, partial [Roseiflexaceae bacterium]|nr:ABC transporter ATP-binding protein [Roseiflexaceae bacterium]